MTTDIVFFAYELNISSFSAFHINSKLFLKKVIDFITVEKLLRYFKK